MSGSSTAREPRRRLRAGSLFVAVHLTAVSAIYAVAWIFGGGFEPPPFSPDLPLAVHEPSVPSASNGGQAFAAAPLSNDRAAKSGDIALPWSFDAEGHVRFDQP